jgi:hypothetical protein
MSRMSENVEASASRNPKGLHGLYRDNFTFYWATHDSSQTEINSKQQQHLEINNCPRYWHLLTCSTKAISERRRKVPALQNLPPLDFIQWFPKSGAQLHVFNICHGINISAMICLQSLTVAKFLLVNVTVLRSRYLWHGYKHKALRYDKRKT